MSPYEKTEAQKQVRSCPFWAIAFWVATNMEHPAERWNQIPSGDECRREECAMWISYKDSVRPDHCGLVVTG